MKFKSPKHKLLAVAEDVFYHPTVKASTSFLLSSLRGTCEIYGWNLSDAQLMAIITEAEQNYIRGKHTKFLSLW